MTTATYELVLDTFTSDVDPYFGKSGPKFTMYVDPTNVTIKGKGCCAKTVIIPLTSVKDISKVTASYTKPGLLLSFALDDMDAVTSKFWVVGGEEPLDAAIAFVKASILLTSGSVLVSGAIKPDGPELFDEPATWNIMDAKTKISSKPPGETESVEVAAGCFVKLTSTKAGVVLSMDLEDEETCPVFWMEVPMMQFVAEGTTVTMLPSHVLSETPYRWSKKVTTKRFKSAPSSARYSLTGRARGASVTKKDVTKKEPEPEPPVETPPPKVENGGAEEEEKPEEEEALAAGADPKAAKTKKGLFSGFGGKKKDKAPAAETEPKEGETEKL